MSQLSTSLEAIYRNALRLSDPRLLVGAALRVESDWIRVRKPLFSHGQLCAGPTLVKVPRPKGRIVAVVAGKAALAHAQALAEALALDEGIAVVPEGSPALPAPSPFVVMLASHPLPSARSLAAGHACLELARALGGDDLFVCAISGGSSSLLEVPAEGLTMDDLAATANLLLRSGADIAAINAVRKRLSAIKGGKLAAASRAPALCLVQSDVPEGRADLVGSGPAWPDPSAAAEARNAIEALGLWASLPSRVQVHLRAAGDVGWPSGRPLPLGAVLAEPAHLRAAAAVAAGECGFAARVEREYLRQSVEQMAQRLVAVSRDLEPGECWIGVGEPTVHVAGAGVGGRCTHLALLMAERIRDRDELAFLACGSDGIDGGGWAAGAVVAGASWNRAMQRGLDPAGALRRFDSARLHAALGSEIVTGPTGNNLNDLFLFARANR